MNLVELLQDQAEDSTALIDRGNSIPFGELDSDTASAASDLRRRNFDPGDTILFFHPVSIRLYVALLAVMRAGLTAVFIDPSASPDFIARCVNLVKPRAFFGSWKARLFLPLKIPVLRDIPKISNFEANAAPDSSEIFPAEGHEPALITFTSGSTGEPKGVARSHEFLLAQHASLSRSLRLEAGQVDLVTLPVFVLANLASGTTSILADTNLARPGVVKAKRVARQIGAGAVTRIVASPAFFESLTKRKKKAVFPGVREVFTGGAPVFPRT
ncbi:MAG: AMP-binding protein, partial [Verrucomicrobiales bacterium]|nr:AMP-binding protein [Verrucomicrobiales bacterium]